METSNEFASDDVMSSFGTYSSSELRYIIVVTPKPARYIGYNRLHTKWTLRIAEAACNSVCRLFQWIVSGNATIFPGHGGVKAQPRFFVTSADKRACPLSMTRHAYGSVCTVMVSLLCTRSLGGCCSCNVI